MGGGLTVRQKAAHQRVLGARASKATRASSTATYPCALCRQEQQQKHGLIS